MASSRNHVAFAAVLLAAGALLVPASGQAACDGGTCPITGGSLRTVVGGGFIIPQLTIFASQSGPVNAKPLTFGNTAMGFVLPTPNAQVTVPSGQSPPFSFMMQIGQLTYGSADPATADNIPAMGARWSTPFLVQVPLFPAPSQALFGVSTNIGQSFPGEIRTYMTLPTGSTTPGSFMTTIGGPATFSAGGRPGATRVETCAGAIVPDPIPATWDGACFGAVPLTPGGSPGAAIVPVTVTYQATANQFGGVASQRQVKRTSQAGPPPIANNWLGRIRFNRFFPAPYTSVQMLDTVNPKTYPTLEQGLVEPVVWGANFGQIVRRVGALVPPGDLVSGRVTPAGRPVDINTQVVAPGGTGMGAGAQTSTSWGGPLTTGRVIVNAFNPGISSTMWTNTGADQRTPGGQGQVSMVSGGISARLSPPPVGIQGGTERTMLTLKLPEPSMAMGLAAGIAALAGVSRRRRR